MEYLQKKKKNRKKITLNLKKDIQQGPLETNCKKIFFWFELIKNVKKLTLHEFQNVIFAQARFVVKPDDCVHHDI